MDGIPDLSHPYIAGAWFRTKPPHVVHPIETWRSLARDHGEAMVALRLEGVLHLRTGRSLTSTASYFGISRKALRKWRDRFARLGVEGLTDHSRAPHSRRRWTLSWQSKEKIVALKREFPVWGRDKLRIEYVRRFGEAISEWQIQRVVAARHLQWIRPPVRRKPGKAGKRPRIQGLDQEAQPVLVLIHADSIELRYADGGRRFIFTNLEHHSRMGFALAASTKHAGHAEKLFRQTCASYPSVLHLHSDNGTDHQGPLDESLPEQVVHWVSRPHTPKDNPRMERFNRTLQDECVRSLAVTPTVPELQAQLDAWLLTYNGVRPHRALGNLTPFQYLKAIASS